MVTPAKDQQDCGSCWAFASVGAFESKLLIASQPTYDLSEEQQIACNTEQSGCLGGSMDALQYWYSVGPMLESCTGYPSHTGVTGACANVSGCSTLDYRTLGYYTVDMSDADEIKTSLTTDGPTYFRYDYYTDFQTFWDSGSSGDVYTQSQGTHNGGHAVLIIGWSDTKQAWLLKNSWGANAGPNGDGTFWMAYSGHANDLAFGMANVTVDTPGVDGGPDLLWRNRNSGMPVVWYMNGVRYDGNTNLDISPFNSVSTKTQIDGFGDFNQDGNQDILWRNPSGGAPIVWFMNSRTLVSYQQVGSISVTSGCSINGVGDFNQDGSPDILWRLQRNGLPIIWYLNNTTYLTYRYLDLTAGGITSVSSLWQINGVGDFNQDGSPDILWRNPTGNSLPRIWYMNNYTYISWQTVQNVPASSVSSNYLINGVADFNSDGYNDILWRRSSNGLPIVWYLNQQTYISYTLLQNLPVNSVSSIFQLEGAANFGAE